VTSSSRARSRAAADPRCGRRAAAHPRAAAARGTRSRSANAETGPRLHAPRAARALPAPLGPGVRVDSSSKTDTSFRALRLADREGHRHTPRATRRSRARAAVLRELDVRGVPTTREAAFEILGTDSSAAVCIRRRSSRRRGTVAGARGRMTHVVQTDAGAIASTERASRRSCSSAESVAGAPCVAGAAQGPARHRGKRLASISGSGRVRARVPEVAASTCRRWVTTRLHACRPRCRGRDVTVEELDR